MSRDNDRAKIIGRRALLLGGGKLALLSALAGRMYYLQVLEADKYATLADENRINLRLLPPPRGRILDRNGVPMAVNQQNYRVLIVSEQTDDLDDTLDSLSNIIPVTEHDRARIAREIKRRRSFVPVTVRENLSWEDVARIEINTPDLPGVMIDVGQSRSYPLEGLGAHLLGYVSAVSEADLQASSDPLLELPGFRIGKNGVERVYDLALRGKGGTSQVEVNAVGRTIRELKRDEGEPGIDLNLTIDLDLQQFAAQRLGAESAAAVVIDIHTGDILVMASTPSFDPNAFNRGLSSDEWRELSSNPRSPLTNKAIAGQYPPGSTFKLMTALAALESGTITADQRVLCPGQMSLGNITFHCWKKGGHGALDLQGGIKNSCDVYFWEIARRTGFERIAEMAKRFGLGAPLNLDLPGERGGNIPNRAWKRATMGQPWHPGDTLNNAIGQGQVLATPLQLAVMCARVANGGYAVQPHLARDLVEGSHDMPRPAPDWPDLGISRQSLAQIRRGMFAVVNEPGGTAYGSRIKDDGMAMSGKSGSAQVRRITMRERDSGVKKNEDLPWKERDHALFIAYAPESEPRYACCVTVEHGGGGSSVAAPMCRDILTEVQKRFQPRGVQGEPSPPTAARPAPKKDSHWHQPADDEGGHFHQDPILDDPEDGDPG
ncbi:penicillin-binding protein 2 [Telmatospirillum sp.]|uniref:penicillin-binding protein 2 n=1 Tax=Telmatospirillum sp. TaxID=2079197 RepID=UPI00284517AC|nr:penicillin-binding protein 2 [Telmatospirillum sp.]MDR3437659.1 penicillin-binding protein 2 [Telmatospirillum sp.]